MTDLAVLRAYLPALDGDFRPLADVIEQGIPLDKTTRTLLAAYLRGEIKRPRGNRRTFSARFRDAEVLRMVELFAEHQRLYAQAAKKLGIPHRAKGGLSTYLECYPSMKEDTLKGILNRARRDRAAKRKRASRVSK
jgi:hypothetical protein